MLAAFLICIFPTVLIGQERDSIHFLSLRIDCVSDRLKRESIVISTAEQFTRLTTTENRDVCDSIPNIDFRRNVLIGYTFSSSGCSRPTWIATIYRIKNEYVVMFQ